MTFAANIAMSVPVRPSLAERPGAAAAPSRPAYRAKHFRSAAPATESVAAPAAQTGRLPRLSAAKQAKQAREARAVALPTDARAARGTTTSRPRLTADQLRAELTRERRVRRTIAVARSTVYALVVVAAAAVLAATLFVPVFRIYGTSMNPTFTEGDVVVATRGGDLAQGDPVVFYYENKVLVKRFIARAGQWVDIDDDGNVYVDGQRLDEPYVAELAKGQCDISFPYQVPDGRIFVLGDNRATSVDSRSSSVGCVSEEQLVGKIVFRVWPLSGFGTV